MWEIPKCPYPKFESFPVPAKGLRFDLGCGDKPSSLCLGVDICSPKAAILADFRHGLPFADRSVSFLKASHVMEHMPDIFGFMDECWRVLNDDIHASLYIAVPRADHRNAIGDPEHVRFFTPNTFVYFTPLWHYRTRQKPWEILLSCWCAEDEIKILMKPIRDSKRLDELNEMRERVKREQNGATCHFY